MKHNHVAESIRVCKGCKATVQIMCACGYIDIRAPIIHGKGCKGKGVVKMDLNTFCDTVANRQRERAAGSVV